MGAIGADRMVEIAQRVHETGDVGLDRFVDEQLGGEHADVGMLRVIESLRAGKYARDLDPIEVVDEPGGLPDGATFEIEGHEFVVYSDGGAKRASDGQRDFSIDVASMPISLGTLKKDRGAEVPEAALDIPFAVRLSEIEDSVYHETSPTDALIIIPYENTFADVQGLYVATVPELALGQGQNKGILFEFDTQKLEGYKVNKPGLEYTSSRGGGDEYELARRSGGVRVCCETRFVRSQSSET